MIAEQKTILIRGGASGCENCGLKLRDGQVDHQKNSNSKKVLDVHGQNLEHQNFVVSPQKCMKRVGIINRVVWVERIISRSPLSSDSFHLLNSRIMKSRWNFKIAGALLLSSILFGSAYAQEQPPSEEAVQAYKKMSLTELMD